MIAALLDHVWQSTLFAGVMGLLTLATRGNRARIRFTLWFAASVKFLVPFALLVTAASELILPFTAPVTTTPDAYMAQEAAQPFAVIAPSLPAPQIAGLNLLLVLFAVWALGFFTLLLVWFLRWLHLRLLLRSAAPMPLALPVTVKTAPGLLEPGLVGIWRPVLLLPVGVATRLTPGEMDAILAHEVCHFRRRDNLTAAIHMLVEALFWFYPLVWWLEARLVEERERACDESVVESGNTPDTYAEAILKVCRFYARSPLACASGVSGADLRLRIETIMAGAFAARLGPAKKAMLVASAAAVLAAPLLMGLSAPPMVEVKLPVPQLVRSSPLYADQVRPRKSHRHGPQVFRQIYRLLPIGTDGDLWTDGDRRNHAQWPAFFCPIHKPESPRILSRQPERILQQSRLCPDHFRDGYPRKDRRAGVAPERARGPRPAHGRCRGPAHAGGTGTGHARPRQK